MFDQDSLVELADDVGVERDTARAALAEARYASAVRDDMEMARRIGITGVPFFVLDSRYGVSGAQSSATFLEALTTARAG